ncbi:unnamed protein product [Lota lota]
MHLPPTSRGGAPCEEVSWCRETPAAGQCAALHRGYECHANVTLLHDSRAVLCYRGGSGPHLPGHHAALS